MILIQIANDLLPYLMYSLRDRIYALLSRNKYQNYQHFSNDGWVNNNNPDDYDSLEAVHNLIHGIIGGSGKASSMQLCFPTSLDASY